MANDIIKLSGCTITLKENRNFKSEIYIGLQSSGGTQDFWRVNDNLIDLLKLPYRGGNWGRVGGLLVLTAISDSRFKYGSSFIHLNSVPEDFLDKTTCGTVIKGDGLLFLNPTRKIRYKLWCGSI
jgi:hypothetical protein